MAKDKCSFVLYSDLIHLVDQLPDETAGQLLKTILDYVNDKNPEPKDLTLRIAFEPIKRQLKRDLKKYEKTKARRSEAGKRGAEAKASKSKQTQAGPDFAKQTQANVSPAKSDQANQAVTDNVNDTVNVTENVIKSKSFVLSFPHKSEEFVGLFGEWVEYRAAIKKPFETFSAQQIELQTLGGYSEQAAIQMIKNAIKNSWKNLRPLDMAATQTTSKPGNEIG